MSKNFHDLFMLLTDMILRAKKHTDTALMQIGLFIGFEVNPKHSELLCFIFFVFTSTMANW